MQTKGNDGQAKREIARERVKAGIWRRSAADGKPRYEITYRDSDGKQRRQVIEGGIRAAETALADTKAKMGKGKRVAPRPNLTFGEAAAKWVATEVPTLRPATRAAYRTALDIHLLPAWGSRRLDRIEPSTVADLVERMQTADYRAEIEQRQGNWPPETTAEQWLKSLDHPKRPHASGASVRFRGRTHGLGGDKSCAQQSHETQEAEDRPARATNPLARGVGAPAGCRRRAVQDDPRHGGRARDSVW